MAGPNGAGYNNWRKARRSKNYGDCAEVSGNDGIIAMRDSKDRQGPVIEYPAASWRAFIVSAKSGALDALR